MKKIHLIFFFLSLLVLALALLFFFVPEVFSLVNFGTVQDRPQRMMELNNLFQNRAYEEVSRRLSQYSGESHTTGDWITLVSLANRLPQDFDRLSLLDQLTMKALDESPGSQVIGAARAYSLLRNLRFEEARMIADAYLTSPQYNSLHLEISLASQLDRLPFDEKGMKDLAFPGVISEPVTLDEVYSVLYETLENPEEGILINYALLRLMNGQMNEALRALRQVSNLRLSGMILALAYYDDGQWSMARDTVRRIPGAQRDTPTLLLLADLAIRLGEISDAIDLFTQLKSMESAFGAVLYSNPSYLYLKQGNYESALQWAQEGLEVFSADTTLWSLYFQSSKALGKYDEALSFKEEVSQVKPPLREVLLMRYFPEQYYNIHHLWQLYNQYPNNGYLIEFLAWSLIREKEFRRAVGLLEELDELRFPWKYYYMGIAFALSGNSELAAEFLDLVPSPSRNSHYYYNIALVQAQMGLEAFDSTLDSFNRARRHYALEKSIHGDDTFEGMLLTQFALYLSLYSATPEHRGQSIDMINRASRLAPKNPRVLAVQNQILQSLDER